MVDWLKSLSTLNRRSKVALQVLVDLFLIVLSFNVGMLIRLESFEYLANDRLWLPLAFATVATIATFRITGLYKSLVRFVTSQIMVSISKGALVFAAVILITNYLTVAGLPRSVPIISIGLIVLTVGGLRFFVRQIIRMPMQVIKQPVVIYGARDAGLEVLNSLTYGRDYVPVAFVDDDPNLQGLTVGGLRVHAPSKMPKLGEKYPLQAILLAMPNLSNARRREIFRELEDLHLEVKTVPGLSDIISGKAQVSDLRNVTAEDLLGRDPVAPDKELLSQNVAGKVVMVTGGGGSIGSELCRQILLQNPKTLIIYEMSEFALYAIDAELADNAKRNDISAKIVPVLGSVQHAKRLQAVIEQFDVQTVYHAAAYKHVPLVEDNIVEGIRNNVFGTLAIATIAQDSGVENFILISTDKAVRPTNVMGATKRIAELICQALSEKGGATTYSMVRFGNVLGSSGSVIPRFQSQIDNGGPVTVTHRDINRYFMTISEASQLVIQAGALAKGGDVFVLDMGEPIKIVDLAISMIKLHGLSHYFIESPSDVQTGEGEIPICFTGLRKGEKLYEELLIGNDPKPTQHSRIMTASEVSLPREKLDLMLDKLLAACEAFSQQEIIDILLELPLDYQPCNANSRGAVTDALAKEAKNAPAK